MNRTSVIYGPAYVTWNSAVFFSKGDIIVELGTDTFAIESSAFGVVSTRITSRTGRVRFTPVGEWEAATKTTLFATGDGTAIAALPVGASIIGATDKDLVITPLSGTGPITFKNACVSALPSLTFRATETILGEVEFMVLGMNDTDWSTADSLIAVGSAAAADVSAFSLPDIITKGYEAAWAATGLTTFAAFEGKEGFKVDFNYQTDPIEIDSVGIIDYRFKGVDVTVTCIPVGPSEADAIVALGIQGAGMKRGAAPTSLADFIIKDGETEATVFTAKNMNLSNAEIGYGQRLRHGNFTWKSNRIVSGTSIAAPFVIA